MGNGIAQVAAQAGFAVTLVDIAPAALERGLAAIEKSLDRLVAKGRLDAAARAAARGRIQTGGALAELAGCDLVVEAVVERFEVKREVLAELDSIAGPRSDSRLEYELDLDHQARGRRPAGPAK